VRELQSAAPKENTLEFEPKHQNQVKQNYVNYKRSLTVDIIYRGGGWWGYVCICVRDVAQH